MRSSLLALLIVIGVAQAVSMTTESGSLCFVPSRDGKVISDQTQLNAIKKALADAAIVQASRAAQLSAFAKKFKNDAKLSAKYTAQAVAAKAKAAKYSEQSSTICSRSQIKASHLTNGSKESSDAAGATSHHSSNAKKSTSDSSTGSRVSISLRKGSKGGIRKNKKGMTKKSAKANHGSKSTQKLTARKKIAKKSLSGQGKKLLASSSNHAAKHSSSLKVKSHSDRSASATSTKAVRPQLKAVKTKLQHQQRVIKLLKAKLQAKKNSKKIALLRAQLNAM